MSELEIIIKDLYLGLLNYVPNKRRKDYTDEFTSRKSYNTKFALKFFPKYIDFEKWSKKPKKPYDINLINYWIYEVPEVGLRYTPLLGGYINGNNKYLVDRLKEEKRKILNPKKRLIPTKEEIPILSQKLLDLLNEIPKEKTTTKNIKSEFDNEQMLLHLADITDEITLKLSNDDSSKEDFNILFRNKIVIVNQSMYEFAFAYTELEKKYRLEGVSLIEEVAKRIDDNTIHITQNELSLFLKEIIRQKKHYDEKKEWKKRIVWTKK
jgi:hypothetical protein